jgi:hypothetical protein
MIDCRSDADQSYEKGRGGIAFTVLYPRGLLVEQRVTWKLKTDENLKLLAESYIWPPASHA